MLQHMAQILPTAEVHRKSRMNFPFPRYLLRNNSLPHPIGNGQHSGELHVWLIGIRVFSEHRSNLGFDALFDANVNDPCSCIPTINLPSINSNSCVILFHSKGKPLVFDFFVTY